MVRRGFRKRRDRVELRLAQAEREVLGNLLTELADWLQPDDEPGPTADPLSQLTDIPQTAARPTDPAMLRLFPDAYSDAEEAADFRRFTEPDLRQGRAQRARRAAATLSRVASNGRIPLAADEAQEWLTALNDVRLVLGTRLGVQEDADPAQAPRSEGHMVYDWLTWLQATLVDALLPDQSGLP